MTPDQVKRVARDYLGSRRIEIDVHPGFASRPRGRIAAPSSDSLDLDHVSTMPRGDTFDRSTAPAVGVPPEFVPPAIKRLRLPNGLDIRIVERHDLPIVNLRLVVRSGETSRSSRQGGPRRHDRQPARRGDQVQRLRCNWKAT